MALIVPGTALTLTPVGPRLAGPPLITGTTISLAAGPRADLFRDPAGPSGPAPDAERFVTTVRGDFQFGGHVSAEFIAPYDSGVLLAWIDENTWFKVCAELDPHGVPRVVSVVTRDGRSDDANAWEIPVSGVFLRIARRGETAALHASDDGHHWDLVRYFDPGFRSDELQIGILAQSPAGNGTTASFRDLFFRTETLQDVRDGR